MKSDRCTRQKIAVMENAHSLYQADSCSSTPGKPRAQQTGCSHDLGAWLNAYFFEAPQTLLEVTHWSNSKPGVLKYP